MPLNNPIPHQKTDANLSSKPKPAAYPNNKGHTQHGNYKTCEPTERQEIKAHKRSKQATLDPMQEQQTRKTGVQIIIMHMAG